MLGRGTSLVVQWWGLHAPNAGGTGSIPGPGIKIPHAAQWPNGKKNAGISYTTWGFFFTKESSINNYLHNTLLFSGDNTKLKKKKEKHSLLPGEKLQKFIV